jgi:penicillin V acylase-like amidase (Ntn superfamily)
VRHPVVAQQQGAAHRIHHPITITTPMLFQAIGALCLAAALSTPTSFTAFGLAPSAAAPCTTFCLPGSNGPVFGRNYDWGVGVALVTVNKRRLGKTALVEEGTEPARWTSKYGSITFNQYGRELPMGGMNEKGLVVEVMWLTDTRFPDPDSRPGVAELTWVQYQLDNCMSVEEVIATDSKIRVTTDSISIHFFVCDQSGEQATIEFLDGKMVAHAGYDLPIPALTNSTYEDSMGYLETIDGFGGDKPTPKSGSSLDRFARAACGVVDYEPSTTKETIAYAFGLLKDVSQGDYTQWSIVYDIADGAIHFKTKTAPAIKTIKLASFDFSPLTPCRILDIDTPKAGDPTELFVDYTMAANLKLIRTSFGATEFLADLPDELLMKYAAYPETIIVPTEPPSRVEKEQTGK